MKTNTKKAYGMIQENCRWYFSMKFWDLILCETYASHKKLALFVGTFSEKFRASKRFSRMFLKSSFSEKRLKNWRKTINTAISQNWKYLKITEIILKIFL